MRIDQSEPAVKSTWWDKCRRGLPIKASDQLSPGLSQYQARIAEMRADSGLKRILNTAAGTFHLCRRWPAP